MRTRFNFELKSRPVEGAEDHNNLINSSIYNYIIWVMWLMMKIVHAESDASPN